MPWHPKVCTVLYSVSCLLDAFDGAAARKYNQSTKFGAVLDMVTDRCTTGCLLCFLSSAYPEYTFIFQLLITIDLASHYIHMYSTLNQGVASHKKIPEDQHWLLRLYYGNNVSPLPQFYLVLTSQGCSLSFLCVQRVVLRSPLPFTLSSTSGFTRLFWYVLISKTTRQAR